MVACQLGVIKEKLNPFNSFPLDGLTFAISACLHSCSISRASSVHWTFISSFHASTSSIACRESIYCAVSNFVLFVSIMLTLHCLQSQYSCIASVALDLISSVLLLFSFPCCRMVVWSLSVYVLVRWQSSLLLLLFPSSFSSLDKRFGKLLCYLYCRVPSHQLRMGNVFAIGDCVLLSAAFLRQRKSQNRELFMSFVSF